MFFTLSILTTVLAIAFVAVCLLMILVILIQKPKGGGLGSAFGGGGGGGTENAAFGAKTGDVLTWVTVSCFVIFLLLAMGLTWTIRAEVSPEPIIPAQATTGPAPAPAEDAADEQADDAGAADGGQVRQSQQTPVAPSPDLVESSEGDVPDETVTDEPAPQAAPEQPTVPEDVEQTLEDPAEEDAEQGNTD